MSGNGDAVTQIYDAYGNRVAKTVKGDMMPIPHRPATKIPVGDELESRQIRTMPVYCPLAIVDAQAVSFGKTFPIRPRCN
jgi:hypothetical protein